MPPENAAVFRAARPFMFAIYPQEDGDIAFRGAVNNPSKDNRRFHVKKSISLILMVLFVFAGCSAPGQESSHNGVAAVAYRAELKEQPVSALDADFAQGVTGFGVRTAEQLFDTDKNLAISPVSIALALAMARAGASGETAQQMKDALGLSALTDAQIVQACKALMWRANTGGMEAANSVWMGTRYTYNEDFVNTCTGDFMADAYPLEIPGAMDAINGWVSGKTHGKIEKLLEEEPSDMTELILVNALYYLGDWVQPFEADSTYDDTFRAPYGAVTASLMQSEWPVPDYQCSDFKMISLAFKGGEGKGSYAMALLLPRKEKVSRICSPRWRAKALPKRS